MALGLNDIRILIAGEEQPDIINDPKYSVSPVLLEAEDNNFKCIGTCFFVTETGVFITAKHVLDEALSDKEPPENSKNFIDEAYDPEKKFFSSRKAIIPQFFPNNKVLLRSIIWTVFHSNSDVAVGTVERKENNRGELIKTIPLVLSARDAKEGDSLFTFAYPESEDLGNNSFNVKTVTSIGEVNKDYPNGRDSVMLPNPCYETSINTKGGSSGGPVFNMLGAVVGINTSGIDESIHFVSKIDNILNMRVPDGSSEKLSTVLELMQTGKIGVYMWDSDGNEDTNVSYEYMVLKPTFSNE